MPLNVRFTDSSALEIFCRNPVLPWAYKFPLRCTNTRALLLNCIFDRTDCAHTTAPPIWRTSLEGQCFTVGSEIAEIDWEKFGMFLTHFFKFFRSDKRIKYNSSHEDKSCWETIWSVHVGCKNQNRRKSLFKNIKCKIVKASIPIGSHMPLVCAWRSTSKPTSTPDNSAQQPVRLSTFNLTIKSPHQRLVVFMFTENLLRTHISDTGRFCRISFSVHFYGLVSNIRCSFSPSGTWIWNVDRCENGGYLSSPVSIHISVYGRLSAAVFAIHGAPIFAVVPNWFQH
jgi:hypothetical protein